MDMTFFQVLWYFLIFLLIGGYFVLDGFDLGVGVLFPFVAKTDKEKAIARRSIGPVWDGNEVWLLTAGGALFAAFPPAYATTFSGFYLAIMLVLFGLIVRAVAIEFGYHESSGKKFWNGCFVVGSFLPALLFGVAVGNIVQGIPMTANGDYSGLPLIGLISPYTLLCGLLGLSMFLAAGATWLARKAPKPSEMYDRASKLRLPLQVVTLVLFVVVSVYTLAVVRPDMFAGFDIVRYLLAALFVVAIIASIVFGLKKQADLAAFISQSAAAFILVALLAVTMFPNLVVASADSIGPALTLMNSSSSETALMWMTIIACIGVPLVLVYHVIVYRTFRGRITDEDLDHSH